MMGQAYFSILRWSSDATRDEARNVAVVLVDAEGQFGGIRAAPMSTISPSLREQGILDTLLQSLAKQFESEEKLDLQRLREMQRSLQRSLYFTEPRPAAVADVDTALHALYRAYVAPRSTPRSETKGVVLDRIVTTLRRRGLSVNRGEYVGDFIFDAVVHQGPDRQVALEVLSFATSAKDWTPAERDAGHFLYGLTQVGVEGRAIIQPPGETSVPAASVSFHRITDWCERASVPVLTPAEIISTELPLALA
jgi:hypothetical protein